MDTSDVGYICVVMNVCEYTSYLLDGINCFLENTKFMWPIHVFGGTSEVYVVFGTN